MRRPTVWAVIFTICGIYIRLGMTNWACLACFIFALFAMLYFVIKERKKTYLIGILFLTFGIFLGNGAYPQEDSDLIAGEVSGIGVIKDRAVSVSGYQKLYVKLDQSKTIYMILSNENPLAIGDEISFRGEALALDKQRVPGGYDERLVLSTRGVSYKIFPEEVQVVGHRDGLALRVRGVKETIYNALSQVLPQEETGIVMAMVTGEMEYIDDDIRTIYTEAGIIHILSISGFHLSVLVLFLFFFFQKVCKMDVRVAAIGTICANVLYLYFTGFSAACVRATCMLFLVLLGKIIFRKEDWLTSIALAALVLLVAQPLYLWNAGFQLSFITTIGLCVSRNMLSPNEGWRNKCKNAIIASLYASLFSFPLVAYHFYYIPVVGILINLALVPLSSILLGCSVLTVLVSGLWLGGGIFVAGSVYVLLGIIKGICVAGNLLPGAYPLLGTPSLGAMACYYGILLVLSYYGKELLCNKKTMLALCCTLLYTTMGNRFFGKQNTVAFLDVGQGDATVITTHDRRAFLIDGGGRFNRAFGENTGIQVVKPYLEHLGIDHLDGIVLTHLDMDHCVGALEIAEVFETECIYISDYPFQVSSYLEKLEEIVEKTDVVLYTVKQDDEVSWDENGTISCLYPSVRRRIDREDENHGSMVLRYRYGGTDVLLMADAGVLDEGIILDENESVKADIIKVGHHGSKGSSSAGFLEEVSAEIGIISCGKDNKYGHPHSEVLTRMMEAKTTAMRTDEVGSILLTLSPDGTYEAAGVSERKPLYERIKETVEK